MRAAVETLTPANALELLAGHDLVVDGTDNFPTRYLASDACEILDLPLVWGSILAFSGQVSVFWGAGGRGVTYRDVHPVPPKPGEVPSCAEAGVLGVLPGVIGALGTTLGDLGVNIANFTLGRSAQGNDAIAILYLDEPISDEALATLQNTGKFLQARRLQFEV